MNASIPTEINGACADVCSICCPIAGPIHASGLQHLPATTRDKVIDANQFKSTLEKIRTCSKEIASDFAMCAHTLEARGGFLPGRAYNIFHKSRRLRITTGDVSTADGAGMTPAQRVISTIAASPINRLRSIHIEDMGPPLSEDEAMEIVDSIISVATRSMHDITILWPLPARAAERLQLCCRQLRTTKLCVRGVPDASFDGLDRDQMQHHLLSNSLMLAPSTLAPSVDITVTPGTTLAVLTHGLEYRFTPEAVEQWKTAPTQEFMAECSHSFSSLKHVHHRRQHRVALQHAQAACARDAAHPLRALLSHAIQ